MCLQRGSRHCGCASARFAARRSVCGSAPARRYCRWRSPLMFTCRFGSASIRHLRTSCRIRAGTGRGYRRVMNSKSAGMASFSWQGHSQHLRQTGRVLSPAPDQPAEVRFLCTFYIDSMSQARIRCGSRPGRMGRSCRSGPTSPWRHRPKSSAKPCFAHWNRRTSRKRFRPCSRGRTRRRLASF